ncbi:O-antigen ligase family protein [Telmatobacter bradus]|uniref:O-antigen ligase family protein n=1 Tax=Telmatobacter bradus TaxID=474953 RepID=UPI003B43C0A6
MSVITLIPGLICLLMLASGSLRKVLLSVYLPTLLLLPTYYVARLAHLPPLSFSDAVALPLGIALFYTLGRRWHFSWMDLWVFLYAFAVVLSEGLSTELADGNWVHLLSTGLTASQRVGTNIADSGLMFFRNLLTIVFPYMVGKLMLEQPDASGQNARRPFVLRFCTLLSIVGWYSIVDFVTKRNSWMRVGSILFPSQESGWPQMVRWGFGRIAGPYGHAILAGMIFLIGLIYCIWFLQSEPTWGQRRLIKSLPITQRTLLLGGVALGLLMAQSRGPWMGMGLSLVFLLLNRYLPPLKAGLVFLAFLSLFGTASYVYGKHYTDKEITQAVNEEQRNVIYRRNLLKNYAPLVAERPIFGWGITTYPTVHGQRSIDNQYLLLALTEGAFGLGLFLLIALGSLWKMLRLIMRPIDEETRRLAFAHISVFIGLLTSLATVYMGEQVVMLFFLMAGWVQSMHPKAPGDGWTAGARFRILT